MTWSNLDKRIQLVMAIVGLIALVWGGIKVLGFSFSTPQDGLNRLETIQAEYHNQADSTHQSLEDLTIHLYEERDQIADILSQQTKLTEDLLIRFCLRDDYEELALQQLLGTCADLGIVRTPNDTGVRAEIAELDTIG